MNLKKYRQFFTFLLICISLATASAQQTNTRQSSYKVSDITQFNTLLKQANQAYVSGKFASAKAILLQAERQLISINAGNEPTFCAELALAFAKVGLKDKASSYQTKAAAVSRGATAISVDDFSKLFQSYAFLNDKTGMKTLFEKAAKTTANPNVIPLKIAYVNGLFGVDENVKAASLLTELYSDAPLSASERAEILSLLMINSIKLNQKQRLDDYYNELVALKSSPTANSDLAYGMYFEHKNQFQKAVQNYTKLLTSFNKGKREIVYLDGVLQLANLHSKKLQKETANNYFNLVANALAKPYQSSAIGVRYLNLFRAHQIRFNKIADEQPDVSLLLKDSIFKNELIAATKELSYKYKIEKDKKRAELLKKQRALDAAIYAKNKQRSLLIIACLGVLIISGAATIYILFQRRKQSNLLHASEMERLKQFQKTELVKRLSASQEQERWRIADQLHDEVGSMLSVIRLNLSEHPLKNETISQEKLATANRILADVADTVREMSHQLMPVAIRQYGLIKSIEQLITDINTAGKLYIEHLIYGFDDVSKYPEDFQISFYRIVQELFQNILKHSKATNAIFQLVEHPDSINLYIEDNGKGIEKDKKYGNGKGIGLLANRIDYYDGKISIEGEPGKGTLIIIDIPTEHLFE